MNGHVRSLLSDYLDGELNEEASQMVEEHLSSCEACASSYRALRRTMRFIQANGRHGIRPQSAERSAERFYRTLMRPGSTEEEVRRVVIEEAQRLGVPLGEDGPG